MNNKSVYKIMVVFMGKENLSAGWPYKSFNLKKQIKTIKNELEEIKPRLSANFEFFGWKLIDNNIDIFNAYSLMEEADGLIIVPLNAEFASLGPDIGKLCEMELPAIIYTKPFSTYYDGYAGLRASGVKVLSVSSSEPNDLIEPLNAIKTIADLKLLRLLVVRDLEHNNAKYDPRMYEPRWIGPAYQRLLKQIFGITIEFATFKELISYYDKIEDSQTQAEYKKFLEGSAGIKEPSKKDIFKAVKVYLVVKRLMEAKNTNGFTVDCLSSIKENKLPTIPCLAISRLNDMGFPSACEGDIDTVISNAISLYLTGHPGFQSDPVIDISKKQVISAHCIMSTCFDGKQYNPYYFRTHTETHKGVGLEVEFKANKPVTLFRIIGTGTTLYNRFPKFTIKDTFDSYNMLAYESETVEHDYKNSEWGCRTKIAIKLPEDDLENFQENFFGCHIFVVYGHHQKKLKMLAKLLGLSFYNKMHLPIVK